MSDTPMIDHLVRVNDVATMLRTSPNTIRMWIRQGRLPAFKINGQYLVDINDIRSMLDANRTSMKEA